MRCNDCNRFVSQELSSEFEQSVDLDDSSMEVNVDFTLSLECTECGNTLATANETGTFEFPQELIDHLEETEGEEGKHELTCDDGDVEGGDYYEGKSRTIKKGPNKGKVVQPPMRYQKHFYTANWTSTISCSCGKDFDISGDVVVQASGFEPY